MTFGRSLGMFAAVSAALIVGATLVLRMLFPGAAQQNAMLVSAGLAFAVQVGAFALLARSNRREERTADTHTADVLILWGMGAVIRLLVLMMFAVVATVLDLPLDAALVSLATYFFLTMMAEPLLLNHVR